jgi:hypothetical protein
MPLNAATEQSLRRVFHEGFSAGDIAEPLLSFDDSAPAIDVRGFILERGIEIVGIRRAGLVAGYVDKRNLSEGHCAQVAQEFNEDEVIVDSAPLAVVVLGLRERPRLFVSQLGCVAGIVTRSDLEKPPVRMWLFGMVTLIEMRFSRMIERFCPNDTWKACLSESRISKAEKLLVERTRRNQNLGLLDCLQFSDKGQILARNEMLRGMTRFESRRQIERTFKGLEQLRNNLAHGQDIIGSDWEMIVLLSENLDRVLEGPPGGQGDDAN